MAGDTHSLRPGFTLVEVLVSLLLLGLLATGVAAAAARLASNAARDGQVLRALDLVGERLARVTSDPSYRQLEARYGGVEAGSTLEGFTRSTTILRVLETRAGGRTLDYKVVEVQVTGPGVPAGVRRTAVVAAP